MPVKTLDRSQIRDTPRVDAALTNKDDIVAWQTQGGGVHASVARTLEREINYLHAELRDLLPLLEAAAANTPVSMAAGDWVRRINALLNANHGQQITAS